MHNSTLIKSSDDLCCGMNTKAAIVLFEALDCIVGVRVYYAINNIINV